MEVNFNYIEISGYDFICSQKIIGKENYQCLPSALLLKIKKEASHSGKQVVMAIEDEQT